jgi:hypothetical protein
MRVVFNFCNPFKSLNTNCPEGTFAALLIDANSTVCHPITSNLDGISGFYDNLRPYDSLNLTGDARSSDEK